MEWSELRREGASEYMRLLSTLGMFEEQFTWLFAVVVIYAISVVADSIVTTIYDFLVAFCSLVPSISQLLFICN